LYSLGKELPFWVSCFDSLTPSADDIAASYSARMMKQEIPKSWTKLNRVERMVGLPLHAIVRYTELVDSGRDSQLEEGGCCFQGSENEIRGRRWTCSGLQEGRLASYRSGIADNAQVFGDDINRLLAMEDMWTHPGRVKPVPLGYTEIMDGSFVTPPLRTTIAAATNASASSSKLSEAPPATNGQSKLNGAADGGSRLLKDQKELSVKENLELFVDR
jgi:hypothetical protein